MVDIFFNTLSHIILKINKITRVDNYFSFQESIFILLISIKLTITLILIIID